MREKLFGLIDNKMFKLAIFILAFSIPLVIKSFYVLHVFIMIFLYSILCLSYNFISGFAGQFSIGHAAFYGVGAYTSALFSTRLGVPFWIAIFLAGIVAALIGASLAYPTLKLKGVYMTLSTLAFGQVIYIIILNWTSLTNGPYGIKNITIPSLFGYVVETKDYYYLGLVLLIISYIVIKRVLVSKTGRAIIAMNEDSIVANSMGVNITRCRLFAFSFSAFFAGIAGSFFAHYVTFVSADSFMLAESTTMLAMLLLGGLNSLPGSIIGPAVLLIASELMSGIYEYRMLIYGLIIIIFIIFLPKGLLGGIPLGMRKESIEYINNKLNKQSS